MKYFDLPKLPLEEWTNNFVDDWILTKWTKVSDAISPYLSDFIDGVTNGLLWIPPEIFILLIVIIAWRVAGIGTAIFALIGSLFIDSVGYWDDAMKTLSVVLVATLLSIIVGVPVGVLSALNRTVDAIVRPILDFMQTLPSFVYLIPAILLFGLGNVPAVIATFIFAAPPAVRMTTLGIRQVPQDVIEASKAFGATTRQLLFKVQLPLAIPTIMAGVNQAIMLALSMAVVASMIGAPGLGTEVLKGISTVNVGLGFTSGLGIVVLAIVLDRITQNLQKKS